MISESVISCIRTIEAFGGIWSDLCGGVTVSLALVVWANSAKMGPEDWLPRRWNPLDALSRVEDGFASSVVTP